MFDQRFLCMKLTCWPLLYIIFDQHLASPQDGSSRGVDLLFIQCQFSLSCSLTVTLDFLHQGAPHSVFSLLLAAALSWALATISRSLWRHVATFYPLHSNKHYCGQCISLLTSGHGLLATLERAVVLVFAVGTVASTATVYDHFLSHKDALKFWTPLTLCYALLVVYTQGDGKLVEKKNDSRIPGALLSGHFKTLEMNTQVLD